MLEFLADEILIVPEVSAVNVVLFFILLAVFSSGFLYFSYYFRKKTKQEASWFVLRQYASRRGVGLNGVKLLREFYDSLTLADRDLAVMNRKTLYSRLHTFFMHDKSGREELKVVVIDKLFPQIEAYFEVHAVKDLKPGEICSVEFGAHHHLGHIMKFQDNRVLISIPDWTPRKSELSQEMKVYVYRPAMGGYLLHGWARDAVKGALIFEQSGAIESRGEQHLMMRLKLPMSLNQWPIPEVGGGPDKEAQQSTPPAAKPKKTERSKRDLERKFDSEEDGDGKEHVDALYGLNVSEEKKAEIEPIRLLGETLKVSDRALTFQLDPDSESKLKGVHPPQELWQLEFTLPDGFRFVCRGKIMNNPASDDTHIFKFLDASDNARRVLWTLIKSEGGERENLT